MKSTRAITIGVTFIAGLYFILDFVVPPTLPVASVEGVVTRTTPASFTASSAGSSPTPYRLSGQSAIHTQIMVPERDLVGATKLVSVPLRQVGPGSVVTIHVGPFEVKRVLTGSSSGVETTDGTQITLLPGQRWVGGTNNAPVAQPASGMSLVVEQAGARIVGVDPGAVELLANGKKTTHRLGARTAVMKVSRYGDGSEVQLETVRTGDTVRLGPATLFADNRDTAAQFNLVITTMAFGIGLLSLGSVHGRSILGRRPGWYVSVFFFAAIFLGIAAGLGKYDDPGTTGRALSDFVIVRLYSAVYSAVFSLLAFYMASAAYRAFRIKTVEAALMLASALIVMLGQTPFGLYLSSWMGERFSALWIPNVAAWILRVPNTATFRGLIFGIMLGSIATALRYWLSMERSVSPRD